MNQGTGHHDRAQPARSRLRDHRGRASTARYRKRSGGGQSPALSTTCSNTPRCLSVSNSLSGGDWELDEVSAVGDPAHVAQIGKGPRVSTDERRRRVSLQ